MEKINHKLDRFLETKRVAFPRFYFLSNDDLLEILGESRDASRVQKHISKFFMGIHRLHINEPDQKNNPFQEVVRRDARPQTRT